MAISKAERNVFSHFMGQDTEVRERGTVDSRRAVFQSAFHELYFTQWLHSTCGVVWKTALQYDVLLEIADLGLSHLLESCSPSGRQRIGRVLRNQVADFGNPVVHVGMGAGKALFVACCFRFHALQYP